MVVNGRHVRQASGWLIRLLSPGGQTSHAHRFGSRRQDTAPPSQSPSASRGQPRPWGLGVIWTSAGVCARVGLTEAGASRAAPRGCRPGCPGPRSPLVLRETPSYPRAAQNRSKWMSGFPASPAWSARQPTRRGGHGLGFPGVPPGRGRGTGSGVRVPEWGCRAHSPTRPASSGRRERWAPRPRVRTRRPTGCFRRCFGK